MRECRRWRDGLQCPDPLLLPREPPPASFVWSWLSLLERGARVAAAYTILERANPAQIQRSHLPSAPLCEFRVERDLHVSCERVAHGAAVLRRFGLLCERGRIDAGDNGFDGQRHRANPEPVIPFGERCNCLGIEALRRESSTGEFVRKGHGETGRVRCCDHLFRTRLACCFLGPACPADRQRAGSSTLEIDCSGTSEEIPLPVRGSRAFHVRHPSLLRQWPQRRVSRPCVGWTPGPFAMIRARAARNNGRIRLDRRGNPLSGPGRTRTCGQAIMSRLL